MSEREHIMPDHPLYLQAKESFREYLEAKERGAPVAEVERLRVISEADQLAASRYHMHVAGTHVIPTH